MSYRIKFTKKADKDIAFYAKTGDKAILKKIQKLLDELIEHPTTGTGHPEQLRYQLGGLWSRKITDKHRLIYEIFETEIIVEIISAEGHYGDK
jgi:toxin YoeB